MSSNRGVLCAKVDHYVERAYSPLRVLHPLRRTGAKGEGSFEQVSWDEALTDIAARLRSIVAESGPTAATSTARTAPGANEAPTS